MRDDSVKVPTRRHRSGPRLPIALRGLGRDFQRDAGVRDDAVVFKPSVGWEVRDIVAEVIVEAVRERSAGDGFGPVKILGRVDFVRTLFGGLWFRAGLQDVVPIPAQMPFADARRAVAPLLKNFGQGDLGGVEGRRAEGIHDAVKLAPVKPPGQERVAARGADARGTVRVGETHALAREAVEIWGGYLRPGILNTEVAVAHVVGVEDNDVGAFGRGCTGGCDGKEKKRSRDAQKTVHSERGFGEAWGEDRVIAGAEDRGNGGLV